jgi:hypothetical protein
MPIRDERRLNRALIGEPLRGIGHFRIFRCSTVS